jgi:hypothetical protein
MKTISNKKLGLSIQLDENQNFPGGTPAMVTYLTEEKEILSGTWGCVINEGIIEEYSLNKEQIDWLNKQESQVNSFLAGL